MLRFTHLCRHVDHQETVGLRVKSLQHLLGQRGLSRPNRPCQKDRSLCLEQAVHQEVVPHSVNCGNHDLVKWSTIKQTKKIEEEKHLL